MPVSVKVISTTDAFADLKDEWNKLLNSSEATVFQSWEWQWVWWQNFKQGKRLFILLVLDDDELIGIAPLVKSFSLLELPLTVVSFLGGMITDYNDFISKRGHEERVVEAVFSYLKNQDGWEALDLNEISESSPNLRILKKVIQQVGDFEKRELAQDMAYRLFLPSDWDNLLPLLSKKFRWNINYYTRRLFRDYRVKIVRVDDEDEVKRAMDEFFKLHRKRWFEKKIPTLLLSKKYQNFHHQISQEFFQVGKLGLYLLHLNGKAVAALYGFEYGNVFYYYLGGFDPDWAHLSVSNVLTSLVVKETIKRGFKVFDFLRGEEEYKLKWGSSPSQNWRILVAKKRGTANLIVKLIAHESLLIKKVKAGLKFKI